MGPKAPIRIVKGLDIPIGGAPAQAVTDCAPVRSVALLGHDYPGLRPALRVEAGERVKLGQPLFADRRNERIVFTSPGSGVVAEINRGARRALLSVVIELSGDESETFPSWPEDQLATLRRDQVVDTMLASGLWAALRARPFGGVADPDSEPTSIFVTAMDSAPLAARAETIIDVHRRDFANGLTVISRLIEGRVFVCQSPGVDLPAGDGDNIVPAAFAGPHPAGLPGTHIHFLDPVSADRTVWHLGYQDAISIGRLFTTRHPWVERTVSLAGPAVLRPRLVRTRLGANLDDLTRGELNCAVSRTISGSVLSGRLAAGVEGYLGRYHNQVSVVAEDAGDEIGGWFGAARRAFSTYRPSLTAWPVRRRYDMTAAPHGGPVPLVPLGGYERVMPLDILTTPLIRALLVGDMDMAQALGCLELEEEDLALCAFVCPSKLDTGALLRSMLSRIEKET